jgi:hypothetical protein
MSNERETELRAEVARWKQVADVKHGTTVEANARADAAEARLDAVRLTRDYFGEQSVANAERLDALVADLRGLVSDWQANGNGRELGDPTAHVWHKCAAQLLLLLDENAGGGDA